MATSKSESTKPKFDKKVKSIITSQRKITLIIAGTVAVLICIMITLITAFGVMFKSEIKALLAGETLYTEADMNNAAENGAAAAVKLYHVNDVMRGVYCNTKIKPDFSKLDWTNASNVESDVQMILLIADIIPPSNFTYDTFDSSCLFITVERCVDGDNAYYDYRLCYNGYSIYEGGKWQTLNPDGFYEINDEAARITYIAPQQEIWGQFFNKAPLFAAPESYYTGDEISSLYVNRNLTEDDIISFDNKNIMYNITTPTGSAIADMGTDFVVTSMQPNELSEFTETVYTETVYVLFLIGGDNVYYILWSSAILNIDFGNGVRMVADKVGWQDCVAEDGLVESPYPAGSKIKFNDEANRKDYSKFFAKTSFMTN